MLSIYSNSLPKYQTAINRQANRKNESPINQTNELAFRGNATKVATENVKKNGKKVLIALLSAIGLGGVFAATNINNVSKPIQKSESFIDIMDVSPEAKAFGKRLEEMKENIYEEVGYERFEKVGERNIYNQVALKKIVELYDVEPKMAEELASITKNSGDYDNKKVEYVIDKYLTSRDMIMEYKNYGENFGQHSSAYRTIYGSYTGYELDFPDMLYLLKALDNNKEIVDLAISKLRKDDGIFSTREFYGLSLIDKSLVEKYLNDKVAVSDFEDVITLCTFDMKYAKEIEELMEISKDGKWYPHHKDGFKKIVESYAKDPEVGRELIKLGGLNLMCLDNLTEPYKENKEFITRLYNDFYKKDFCEDYCATGAFTDIGRNYKMYEMLLNLLNEKGWQGMSDEEFLNNMKSIMKAIPQISQVLRDANGDLSQCASRIVNIIKAS